MLSKRLLSAAILISCILVFVFADAKGLFDAGPGLFLIPVHLFLILGTAYEFASMVRERSEVSIKHIIIATLSAAIVGAIPVLYQTMMRKQYPADCPIGMVGWSAIGAFFGLFLLVLEAMHHYRQSKSDISTRLAHGLAILLYCSVLPQLLMCIRMSPPNYSGLITMVGFVMTVKMSDAGAYFTGRAIGKRPLDQVISPKKTLEGAIGGFVIAALVCAIFFLYLKPNVFGCDPVETQRLKIWGPLLAGIMIAFFGLIGDLLESVIKRSCGVKDSSQLLPGLGGVWDVTDSMFFAAPVGYLAILAGLIG